jgi:hypothetical protein
MPLPSRSNRRSDEIRRRRVLDSHVARQATQKKGSGSLLGKAVSRPEPRRKTSGTPTPPPVMARGFSAARTRPIGRSSRGGRRVHRLTLGSQGAEMSLPSMPRFGFTWRFASLILLAFVGAALYYLWTSPDFQVEAAQISGLRRLTRGDVNKELALRNEPVFMLDAEELETELLEAFPEFSSAEVVIDLPNTLLITVTERVPVLVWRQDDATILVDNDGMTFQARDHVALSGLPVVEAAGDPPAVPDPNEMTTLEKKLAEANGEELPDEVDDFESTDDLMQQIKPTRLFTKERIDAILEFSDYLPQGAALIYHPVHGFGWQDSRGWAVVFGDLSDLAIKLNEYQAVLEKIKASGGTPELISVEFVHAPYYRLKEQGDE